MKTQWRYGAVLALAGIGVALCIGIQTLADPLAGGGFELVGGPAAGGTSTGGGFKLTGWIPNAGAGTSSGNAFDLTCGLIGIYAVTEGEVALTVNFTTDGRARLWWPPEATGYRLVCTTQLGPAAVWEEVSPAPVGNEFVTGPAQPARFFRLVNP